MYIRLFYFVHPFRVSNIKYIIRSLYISLVNKARAELASKACLQKKKLDDKFRAYCGKTVQTK